MSFSGEINLSRTKIIAVSAFTENLFRNNTEYSIYFDAFVEKPVNGDILANILKGPL